MCDGRWFIVGREACEEPARALRLLGGVASLVASVKVSNLARWALERAAVELVTEEESARAKLDEERASLVTEIRKRRTEADPMRGDADPARAFQLAQRELFMVTRGRALTEPVPWVELDQVPIGGAPRFEEPTEGAVVAYAGRVFVVVQLRKPEGWDPIWCLLSLSGDVCGWTEAGA